MRFATLASVVSTVVSANKRQRAPVGTVSLNSTLAAGLVPVIDRMTPRPSSELINREPGQPSGCCAVT
jgi:hypothetical protein